MSTHDPAPIEHVSAAPGAHPSYLALDLAALGVAPSEVVRHVDRCDTCRAHIAAMRCSSPLPRWLPDPPPSHQRLRAPKRAVLAASLAAAALLIYALRPTPEPPAPEYIGAKGRSPVVVFVREGQDVRVWRRERLRPQASIRLGIHLSARTHVAVYSISGGDDRAVRVFAGLLEPGAPALIDRAWRLDDAPGPERLYVVLGPIDPPLASTAPGLRLLDLHPRIGVERVELHTDTQR